MSSKFYHITAITPEMGEIVIDTFDEKEARKVHSNLLGRQLNNDGTHSVKVSLQFNAIPNY
jgi:hypothetical protein